MKHNFTLIGNGEEWVVFDPWPQCPTACTAEEFRYEWNDTIMVFPPKLAHDDRRDFAEGLDLAEDEKHRLSAEVIEETMNEHGEAPGESYLADVFASEVENVKKRKRTLWSEVSSVKDPDVRYVSSLHIAGKQYNEVPRAIWHRTAEAFETCRQEEEKGKDGLLAGLTVKLT